MASLTEAAKAVLEGKQLTEGAYPEVSPGKISNPNPVDPSTASTGNAKTLRPGSKSVEGRHANPGAPDPSSFGGVDDLGGATPTSVASDNLGAKAAGKTGKDTSKSSKASVAPEAKKSLKSQPAMAEEMEEEGSVVAETSAIAERVATIKEAAKKSKMKKDDDKEDKDDADDKCMEEELELSEELEDFINEAIEAGLDEEEILAAIEENFEFSEGEEIVAEEIEESPVEAYQVDMSEHVNALLEGEDLSEEFHAKATTIFEAAVKAKLEEEVALLEQAYAETLEERVSEIMEQLSTDVDNYLNYVVEQWIEENEVAVESALRSELTEDFIGGLRSLFAEHYIDIPEEEVAVVEELSQTVEELEAKLNEEIERNVALTGMIAESRKNELVAYVCEGLTTTQAEKLKGLVENVAYTDDDQFIEKISTLRENYFPTSVKADAVLDRVESADPKMISESTLEGPMAKYVQALGRNLPK
jgi:DNA-binding transcriptional regulator YhcF (GntR family)